MLVDHPSIFVMRQDVSDFIHDVYNESLPTYTSDADVRVLWVASSRMSMFLDMAEASKTQQEYDFMMAVHNDYKMLFYGMLHAIDVKSDEIANLRHRLAEKNAQDNLPNIDSYAEAGD